jgi:hypothetical protein
MCIFELLNWFSCGEFPQHDTAVASPRYYDVLTRSFIKLQAQHGCVMSLQRRVDQALSIQIPDPNSVVAATTDKEFARVLDSVYTFFVGFLWILWVWKLEIRESSGVPIVLQSLLLFIEILPVDFGFRVGGKKKRWANRWI